MMAATGLCSAWILLSTYNRIRFDLNAGSGSHPETLANFPSRHLSVLINSCLSTLVCVDFSFLKSFLDYYPFSCNRHVSRISLIAKKKRYLTDVTLYMDIFY
jgi:hypothetical protein